MPCHRQAAAEGMRSAFEKLGIIAQVNLFDQPGGYVRLMDKNALARPCPGCGGKIEKFAYLGGSCYICPHCQK